ncbi:hypothetical protein SRHO_G00211480 [Serrasalmus rhombeus]
MTSKMSFSEEQHSQKAERLVQGQRPESPEPSCVSMKSDRSMGKGINFREDNSSSELSYVSMKSDQSMGAPVTLREEDRSTDLRVQKNLDIIRRNMEIIFKELEHKVVPLVKNQLKRFVKLLSLDYPACSDREVEDEEDQSSVREGALKITLTVLRNMNQTDLTNTLESKLAPSCHLKLKSTLKQKYQKINEGISNSGTSTLLNEIYTELYVTECDSGEVNNEHEWSAVAFVLLNSEEELDEFDLRKYDPSEKCFLRLLPVVKASRKAVTRVEQTSQDIENTGIWSGGRLIMD